ncbi:serine hydrolase domain-containing protein [Kutzneria sp. NPDC051319]|uniref:serine hydrolase domain-containing protein n=1 Tax=Kutzneria sp. NPDC051319 TaxID=3155047 RepID=UPI00341E6925
MSPSAPSDSPGTAVAVIRAGEVIHQECTGFADLEWRQPIAPDTVFPLASITKSFTALVVQRLIDLDTTIGAYLSDYPTPGRDVTVRQLLNHTSGIPEQMLIPEFRERRFLTHTSEEVLAFFTDLPLDFPPGSRYAYSNTGYWLLGLIIEAVTGSSYGEAVAEHVFRPAGMADSRMLDDDAVIPRRARGYAVADGVITATQMCSATVTGAAGALLGTLDDMVRYDQFLKGHEFDLASRTPGVLTSGRATNYGFGWVLGDYRGTPYAAHAGGLDGHTCLYARFPQEDLSIILLGNHKGHPIYQTVLDLAEKFLGLPVPTVPPAGPMPVELAGAYRDHDNVAELTATGDGLTLTFARKVRPLRRLDESTLICADDPDIRLHLHEDGGITVDYPFYLFTGYRDSP